MKDYVLISKATLAALAAVEPSAAAALDGAGADFDMDLATEDPGAAVDDARRAMMRLPKSCPSCSSPLEVRGADGTMYTFSAHTAEYCAVATRHRVGSLMSFIRRDALELARLRLALAEAGRERVDAAEMYSRAMRALDVAGVPGKVEGGDELDYLASRIRWLATRGAR